MDVDSTLLQQVAETIQDHRALLERLKSLADDDDGEEKASEHEVS